METNIITDRTPKHISRKIPQNAIIIIFASIRLSIFKCSLFDENKDYTKDLASSFAYFLSCSFIFIGDSLLCISGKGIWDNPFYSFISLTIRLYFSLNKLAHWIAVSLFDQLILQSSSSRMIELIINYIILLISNFNIIDFSFRFTFQIV